MKTASKSHSSTFEVYSHSSHFYYCLPGASHCHLLPGVLQYLPSYFIFLRQSSIPWNLFQYCSSSDLTESKTQIMSLLLGTFWWILLSLRIKSQCLSLRDPTSSGPPSVHSNHTDFVACFSDMLAGCHLRAFAQMFSLTAFPISLIAPWLTPLPSSDLCSNLTFSESKTLIFLTIT